MLKPIVPNIKEIKEEFVKSNQFDNFKLICEHLATLKFKEMMSAAKKDHAGMLEDRAVLKIYMDFASILENRVKADEDLKTVNEVENK